MNETETTRKEPRMKTSRLSFEYLGVKVLTISEDPYNYVGVDAERVERMTLQEWANWSGAYTYRDSK